MTLRVLRLVLVMALAAPAAFAQFEIYLVDGNIERAVPPLYELGSFLTGEFGAARFRIRNISANPAVLSLLKVRGPGFSLAGAPALPTGLAPQQAIEFQVIFQSSAPGTYSAALDSEGISVLLAATVIPSLTYSVDSQILGAAPLDFGSVEPGSAVLRHVRIENRTGTALMVPRIVITGTGFSLEGIPPSGAIFQPLEVGGFDLRYEPAAAGISTGSLSIGGHLYALMGTALAPPLPKPSIAIDLQQPLSARQGTLTVTFDAPARAGGTGIVSLDFEPDASGATDPAIQFAAGGRTVSFSVSPGDTQASFAFQTGTTAGTLEFRVEVGGTEDRKAVSIARAIPALTASQALRTNGSVEVRLTGFDNTRTVNRIFYAFFDASGNPIAPGTLEVDSASDFARFFQNSDAGGNFLLRATFPVTGDVSKIAAFEAEIVNAAGASKTGRIPF